MEIKTYATMISALELLPADKDLFVSAFYPTGTMEWIKVDKAEYLRCIQMVDKPRDKRFPCKADHDRSGNLFIETNAENPY
jgi:hypothetical protein